MGHASDASKQFLSPIPVFLFQVQRAQHLARSQEGLSFVKRCPFPIDNCNVLCTSHSKDNERRLKAGACFNLSSAKLLNLELSVAV